MLCPTIEPLVAGRGIGQLWIHKGSYSFLPYLRCAHLGLTCYPVTTHGLQVRKALSDY